MADLEQTLGTILNNPQLMQQIIISLCQGFHGGYRIQKTAVIPLHRFHPSLLEHNLRQPHMVGLPVLPPWQIPLVGLIPGQQQFRQLF